MAYNKNRIYALFPHGHFLKFCLKVLPFFNKFTQEDIDQSFQRYITDVCYLADISVKHPLVKLIELLQNYSYVDLNALIDPSMISHLCQYILNVDEGEEYKIIDVLHFIYKAISYYNAKESRDIITKNSFDSEFIKYLNKRVENPKLCKTSRKLLELIYTLPMDGNKTSTKQTTGDHTIAGENEYKIEKEQNILEDEEDENENDD